MAETMIKAEGGMRPRVVVIIPARFESSRLPGKPLIDLGGQPMIRRVYDRAARARVDAVWVATDDARIVAAVRAFGGRVVMTSRDHPSGTDRVAEAARALEADIVVNVQGDEPLLEPDWIDLVAAPLMAQPSIVMATLAHPMAALSEAVQDPNVVKVVCDKEGFALYFSRFPIPFDRDRVVGGGCPFLRHVGLYAYRADFLQAVTRLPPSVLERCEQLEQLRVLEHGHRIRVVITHDTIPGGVDTPQDVQRVRALLAAQ